ncbi:MAG: hypothetical protein ACOX9C_04760 [Kiritimatiellia bacterium]|jgi:hypothetical protein
MRDQNPVSESIGKGLKEHERRETRSGCFAIFLLFVFFPVAWTAASFLIEDGAYGFVVAGIITIGAMVVLFQRANR